MARTLPPVVARMTKGRWPFLWLALASVLVLLAYAAPELAHARDTAEQTELERSLVERQAAIAASAPEQRELSEHLGEWWRRWASQRVRADTLESAAATAQDRLQRAFAAPGLTVAKIERVPRDDLVLADPPAQLVVFNLRVQAERMQPLLEALADLEGAGGIWVRVGNTKFTRPAYRDVPGVQMDATLYACTEAGSPAGGRP